MASRVRSGDLRNISGAFPTHRSCPICSGNQRDHLKAGRLFMCSFAAKSLFVYAGFGCILLTQVGIAIMHSCTSNNRFLQKYRRLRKNWSVEPNNSDSIALRYVGFGTRLIDLDMER
jgi:hypothetical protein